MSITGHGPSKPDAPHWSDQLDPTLNENAWFIAHMFHDRPHGSAPLVCGFRGDPNGKHANWSARNPFTGRTPTLFKRDTFNAYVVVSSFFKTELVDKKTGEMFKGYARRKNCFAALHFLMLDDLGTGKGAKLSMDKLVLPPTYLIETSPDNYQAMLKLKEPITDFNTADKLIRAMIEQGLAAEDDPGMSGVTRYCRLPVGINGKKKYGGWQVNFETCEPDVEYTLDEITEAFNLDLSKFGARAPRHVVHADIRKKSGVGPINVELADDPIYTWLSQNGRLHQPENIKDKGEDGVFVDMTCPWVGDHTDEIDDGTAYRIGGGFVCHHGHCKDKTVQDLLEELGQEGLRDQLDLMQTEHIKDLLMATAAAVRNSNPYF